jgi:Cu-Zn family superoxide dismutase
VKVVLKIGNAPPGLKGAHIHEKGDCSAKDGSSAGDHFNPEGHQHARPPDEPRHLGDLGNIGVTPEGVGLLEIVVKGANLKPGDPKSFLDRAVIIHQKKGRRRAATWQRRRSHRLWRDQAQVLKPRGAGRSSPEDRRAA